MSQAGLLELFPELQTPATSSSCGKGGGEEKQRSPVELVRSIVKLHEARVTVHKAYDGAFNHLLTGNGGGAKAVARTYPFVVACATASFQVLSGGVRDAISALEAAAAASSGGDAADIKEAVRLAKKVQGLEQARLQLVAINHVEQSQLHTPGGNKANFAKMRQQLGSAAEEIEETVSELRYAAAELAEAE